MLLTRVYVTAAVLAAASAVLLQQRHVLLVETTRLQKAHDSLTVAAADARLQQEVDGIRLALERSRQRATGKTEPHLAVAITDGLLTLERGDIVLRSALVTADVTRGVRRIARVDGAGIVLDDSTRIYGETAAVPGTPGTPGAPPVPPPVPPNSVRLSRSDFEAVLPNVRPGLTVYFF